MELVVLVTLELVCVTLGPVTLLVLGVVVLVAFKSTVCPSYTKGDQFTKMFLVVVPTLTKRASAWDEAAAVAELIPSETVVKAWEAMGPGCGIIKVNVRPLSIVSETQDLKSN